MSLHAKDPWDKFKVETLATVILAPDRTHEEVLDIWNAIVEDHPEIEKSELYNSFFDYPDAQSRISAALEWDSDIPIIIEAEPPPLYYRPKRKRRITRRMDPIRLTELRNESCKGCKVEVDSKARWSMVEDI